MEIRGLEDLKSFWVVLVIGELEDWYACDSSLSWISSSQTINIQSDEGKDIIGNVVDIVSIVNTLELELDFKVLSLNCLSWG